ncbi:Poly(glycerol-phosphate) alpha-glucosyltransferase [BD1-7 clade bacterium]|uniref:Poly(Glycerol-phosphate) alpha-glucosyltransferase n=1 Tax=BD1-7 clade bacterium TaxID=2029982 RepID=A0A5S9MZ69_9GAMM|nr:Poly(glycerol-phosphate) alpha-glucosyltransferase [BD1-7 clade bacterium]
MFWVLPFCVFLFAIKYACRSVTAKGFKMHGSICVICNGVSPELAGGVQTFCRNLGLIFPGNLVFVDAFKERSESVIYRVPEMRHVIPARRGRLLKKVVQILNRDFRLDIERVLIRFYLLFRNADCYVINSPKDIRAVGAGRPIILVQHTRISRMKENKDYFDNNADLLAEVRDKISMFVVLSPYDVDPAQKLLGIDKDKIHVVRHMSSIPLLCGEKAGGKVLVMVGRLVNSVKRFDLVIDAMRCLPDFELKIYGNGPDRVMLEKTLLENGIANVELCGPTSDVTSALDKGGVYVSSSEVEGYGISLIEAMRRGLPVVVRDTYEAAVDIVEGNGVLLNAKWDRNEFIEAVKMIENNYESMSHASLIMGARHSEPEIARQWKDLHNTLIE